MQLTVNIEDANLQAQISRYILDKKQESNEFVLDVIKQFFQKEDDIAKVVENSQRIEGYEPVSKEVTVKMKALLKKHNVKVSFSS